MTVGDELESDRPRLILNLPNFAQVDPKRWDHLFLRASIADRVGIDGLWVGEHLVLGDRLDQYSAPELGGRVGEKMATGTDGVFLDPMIVLAAVCGITRQIRLMTSVLLGALRRPMQLAKECATLCALSGGRLDLGVGIGWQREEYDAAGVDFHRRGALLDHVLEVCESAWTSDPVSFTSDDLTFGPVHFSPRPKRRAIPILVSGTTQARALRRFARFGDGWMLWGEDRWEPQSAVDRLRQTLREVGRPIEGLRVVGPLRTDSHRDGRWDAKAIMSQVPRLVDAGVTDFRVTLDIPALERDAVDALSGLLDSFRTATAPREHDTQVQQVTN